MYSEPVSVVPVTTNNSIFMENKGLQTELHLATHLLSGFTNSNTLSSLFASGVLPLSKYEQSLNINVIISCQPLSDIYDRFL